MNDANFCTLRGGAVSPCDADAYATMGRWRCSAATLFYNYKSSRATFRPPTGYVARFPLKAQFTRDFVIEANVAFGATIARVVPAPHIVNELPSAAIPHYVRRVNTSIPDDSPYPPRVADSSPDAHAWAPYLGRGGRVGLYKRVSADACESEWFVVVFAGLDESTLREFERAMEVAQTTDVVDAKSSTARKATFADVLPYFERAEAVAERNRQRVALAFAHAVGFKVVVSDAVHREIGAGAEFSLERARSDLAGVTIPNADRMRRAVQWYVDADDARPAGCLPFDKVPWYAVVPSRDVRGAREIGDLERVPLGVALLSSDNAADRAMVNTANEYAASTVMSGCCWNTLRRCGAYAVFASDAVYVGDNSARVVVYGDPCKPVPVFGMVSSSTSSSSPAATIPLEALGAVPCVVPCDTSATRVILPEEEPRHFWTDGAIATNAQVNATYAAWPISKVLSEVRAFGKDFEPARTSMLQPVLVRHSNRAYDGTVRVGGGGNDGGGAGDGPEDAKSAARVGSSSARENALLGDIARRLAIVDHDYAPP